MMFRRDPCTGALIAAALLAAGFDAAGASTLNECKTSDGKTIYLWDKCPESTQEAATPPAADTSEPTTPASAGPAPAPLITPAGAPFITPATTPFIDPSKAPFSKPPAVEAPFAKPRTAAAPFARPPAAATAEGPKARGGFPAPASRDPEMETEMVVEVTSGYTVCGADNPGFRAKYAAPYEIWKLKNAAMIARVQSDPEARRQIEERIAFARDDRDPASVFDRRRYCDALIAPFLRRFGNPG
jgi:hypothetical protein